MVETWGEVSDFSRYTEARLLSYRNFLDPNSQIEQLFQKAIFNLAAGYRIHGREAVLQKLSEMRKTLGSTVEKFVYDSLFPEQVARYAPETPLSLIMQALSEGYYEYSGYILEPGEPSYSDSAGGYSLQAGFGRKNWQEAFLSSYADAQMTLLSKGMRLGEIGNDSMDRDISPGMGNFSCKPSKGNIYNVYVNSLAFKVMMGSDASHTTARDAYLAQLAARWHPILDTYSYGPRKMLSGIGGSLQEVRETLNGMGVKTVTKKSLTLRNGTELELARPMPTLLARDEGIHPSGMPLSTWKMDGALRKNNEAALPGKQTAEYELLERASHLALVYGKGLK